MTKRQLVSVAYLALAFIMTTGYANAGTIRSKAGATASVANKYVSIFQAYINALERHGARIPKGFLGGIRKGRCAVPRHKHPCGMAIDVCQLRRGVVDRRCNLPSPAQIIKIANSVGLTEGAEWTHSDYGHAEIPTGNTTMSARHRRTRQVATRKVAATQRNLPSPGAY